MPQVRKIRVSVVLDSETDRKAKAAAKDAGKCKSPWIAALVARELQKKKIGEK